jgi:hypothetical protein
LIWALVVLALLSALTGMLIGQVRASRRQLDRRQNRYQAEWLARAGIELAAAHLLRKPAGYSGESVELIPGSKVRIEVTEGKGAANVFRVSCEAHYPTEGLDAAEYSLARRFRRVTEKEQVRLEVLVDANTTPAEEVP